MKFYTIGPSRDISEIGAYPQTLISPDTEHDFYNVKPYEFPEFVPKGAFVMADKAKMTDLIEGIGIPFGFIISGELKQVFEKSNLPPSNFYPIKVYQESTEFEYYWFHFISGIKCLVDRAATTLTLFDKFTFEIIEDDIALETLGDVNNFQRNLSKDHRVRIKRIVLKPDAKTYSIMNVDILFSKTTLISEELKDKITQGGLTGMEINQFKMLESN